MGRAALSTVTLVTAPWRSAAAMTAYEHIFVRRTFLRT